MTETAKIIEMGFPADRAQIVHSFVGGSALHGVKLHGTDDTDIYGVFVQRPEFILGIDGFDHFVTSTSPQEQRNEAHDVDVTCLSLRKWAGLAAKGNSTVLHFLFTPAAAGELAWSRILGNTNLFLAKSHYKQYAGYADAQLKRMIGLRGQGKHGQRPELEQQFGYDVKAAMHVLRILGEGIELMEKGFVTLPVASPWRETLLEVRSGEWSAERVISTAGRMFDQIHFAAEASALPDSIDRARISKLIAEVYAEIWQTSQQEEPVKMPAEKEA